MFEGNAFLQLIDRLRGVFISRDNLETVVGLNIGTTIGAGEGELYASSNLKLTTNGGAIQLRRDTGGAFIDVMAIGGGTDILNLRVPNSTAGSAALQIINTSGTTILTLAGDGKIKIVLAGIPAYANNAAAVAGGLAAGTLYRTGGDPDLICIVH